MIGSVDLITMIGNLSQSLQSVERLVGGLSYLIGIALFFIGLMKLKKVSTGGGRSQETHSSAGAFLFGGILLLFLPSALHVASNTVFGSYNILQYTNYNPMNIFESLGVLLQAFGLFWFVRGCIVITHSSKAGNEEGVKGFFFIIAGVLAMNFTYATSAVQSIVTWLVNSKFTF